MSGLPPDSPFLPVGQLNTPDIEAVEQAFADIFARRYYTNHGPLVARFERAIEARLGVRHAIAMTNGTVALMIAARCLGVTGKVVMPAFTFPATAQALSFAGYEPVFCDVDPATHAITPETVEAALEPGVVAIAGVHLWGLACDVAGLSALADRHGLTLFFDAAHAFDCAHAGRAIGGFGAFETFSFHATKVLNCAEGGCVTTDDADLAARIRTAANFHEQQTFARVPLRFNAKMSEAQAAMGLLSIERLDGWIASNRAKYERYRDRIGTIGGLRFVDHADGIRSNWQYVVLEIEPGFPLDQVTLMRRLHASGVVARRYFYPGLHNAPPYNVREWHLPVTDMLCTRVLQVPSGYLVGLSDVDRVCDLLEDAASGRL